MATSPAARSSWAENPPLLPANSEWAEAAPSSAKTEQPKRRCDNAKDGDATEDDATEDDATEDDARSNTPDKVFSVDKDTASRIDDIDADDAPGINSSTLESSRRFASSSSFYTSQSLVGNHDAELDFIHLVTEISRVYQRGAYLKMMNMDSKVYENLGQGSTFSVSSSSFTFRTRTVSSQHHRIVGEVSNKLVIKRVALSGLMNSAQVRSFIRELRVLDHLFTNPFIVDLRGIGWFNEFHNGAPSPKPAIILEEAFGTLDFLLTCPLMDFESLFGIFAQVAFGLAAVHRIRVAHGDIKPGNVLLFKMPDVRDGVEGHRYIAKLSDFGSTIFDTGSPQPFPPGTLGYQAPEAEAARHSNTLADFEDILQTDIWSLGILFAVLWCGETEAPLSEPGALDPRARKRELLSRVWIRLGNSAAEPELVRVAKVIFNNTLQTRPHLRHLDLVKDNLSPYLPQVLRTSDQIPSNVSSPGDDIVTISYEGLKHLSGNIKDTITAKLEEIAESQDPRNTQALWELGVIYLSRFSNPTASIQKGLSFVWRSAHAGDSRARALYKRLCDAFDPKDNVSKDACANPTAWLEDAAISGHQTALVELAARGDDSLHRVKACQAATALSRFEPVPNSPIEHWNTGTWVSARKDTVLHRAAATGRADHLEFLSKESDTDLNARNLDGNTPLLLACQFGQLETALALLSQGANAAACNNMGENALHFCWCFFGHDSETIIDELLDKGAETDAIAMGHPLTVDLDILPLLPGTPAERAAGRRRFDLVMRLLQHKNILLPSNGYVARRILVWALRLQDVQLQRLILQRDIPQDIPPQYFMIREEMQDPLSIDPDLSPIWNTTWLYKGEERSLVDAACAGWVTGTGTNRGWDVPFGFWLACCVGAEHTNSLRQSLIGVVDMLNTQAYATEKIIDQSILWVFGESLYDAFVSLLRLKAEKTGNHRSRLQDVTTLTWELQGNNPCLMPSQTAHLIDRIFYSKERGTLLQQAVTAGDRRMFRLLLRWHANPRLPAPIERGDGLRLRNVSNILGHNVNVYSLLAYAEHKDLWFARDLQRLEVPLSCPWSNPPFNTRQHKTWGISFQAPDWGNDYTIYVPPLLEAIGLHFWEYTLWLLNAGASLEEQINAKHALVDVIAGMHCQECVEHLFKDIDRGRRAVTYLPQQYRGSHSYLLYRVFFAMFDDSVSIGHTRNGTDQSCQPLECLRYLLNEHPLPIENSSQGHVPVSSQRHSRFWLVRQVARIGNQNGDALQLLFQVWKDRNEDFPRQDLSSYLRDSPADRFEIPVLRRMFEDNDKLTLAHISPSIQHPRVVFTWRVSYKAILLLFAARLASSVGCFLVGWTIYFGLLVRWVSALVSFAFWGHITTNIVLGYFDHGWLDLAKFLRAHRLPRVPFYLHAMSTTFSIALLSVICVQAITLTLGCSGYYVFGWNPSANPFDVTSEPGNSWQLCYFYRKNWLPPDPESR